MQNVFLKKVAGNIRQKIISLATPATTTTASVKILISQKTLATTPTASPSNGHGSNRKRESGMKKRLSTTARLSAHSENGG